MSGEIIPLTTFNDVPIHVAEDELVSLTDLWAAAGSPETHRPNDWINLPETKRFVAFQVRKLNAKKSGILRATRGRNGGTWGHWKIALDYAAYLSAPLKDHIYEVFKERLEEDADPELGFQRWQERAEKRYERVGLPREWVAARLRSILVRKMETDSLKAHGILESKDYAGLTNETYRGLFGHPAQRLKEERGLTKRDNLRDHLNEVELVSVAMAETLARHKIEREDQQGFRACARACRSSAEHVREAVRKDLGEQD
jgi:hypothetical protein